MLNFSETLEETSMISTNKIIGRLLLIAWKLTIKLQIIS